LPGFKGPIPSATLDKDYLIILCIGAMSRTGE